MTVPTTHHSGTAFRAAEAFAEAIRTMPEWEEWESARAEARTHPELQRLSARRRTLLDQAHGASGSRVAAGEAELEQVRRQIVEHPASLRQQAAVRDVIELLRALNVTLSGALGLDFVQFAAPPRTGGCCG